LRDAERNEVNDVSTVARSIDQVSHCAANNHAENEFHCQRAGIEHAQVEVGDDGDRGDNQYYQDDAVGEEAKRRPIIADIVENQVLADQMDLGAKFWGAQVFNYQRLGPLIEYDHQDGRK